jgi:hypothetical protein
MPAVTPPLSALRSKCDSVRTWTIFDERDLYRPCVRLRPCRLCAIRKRETPPNGGALSNSALVRVLAGLLTGLLRLLLPRLLGRLLTLLLVRLIRLTALLRLALVVLFHEILQKIA